MVSTHMSPIRALIEHREQLKEYHICVKLILMLPLEMPLYIKV
jgi:hypothetical protein